MASAACFLLRSPSLLQSQSLLPPTSLPSPSLRIRFPLLSNSRPPVLIAYASPNPNPNSSSKKSILSNLIQEIEPMDLNLIQKDVPTDTVDAMKRTISGMLGLLPSNQFHVLVEAFWDPLSNLLVSSMMTGYTMRNAEYRLCLERNLDLCEDCSETQNTYAVEHDNHDISIESTPTMSEFSGRDGSLPTSGGSEEPFINGNFGMEKLGKITPQAEEYILHLESRLFSAEKELHDLRVKNSAPQMQQLVDEEKNDLLDYLRSLLPDKVAELSEPACPIVRETIHTVVHGLLATLSPKMQSKSPPQSENNAPGGTLNVGEDDCAELVENTSIQFQPMISLQRDYLARLLFWCMLLGHYLRGLECRLELMQLLTISSVETTSPDGDYVA